MSKTRTITLTNRPPVRITEERWPIIAEAVDEQYDNEFRFQANRTSDWWIRVRQHEDGRTLVYAGYDYGTNWQGERGLRARQGQLMSSATSEDLVEAIRRVCHDISQCEHAAGDDERWDTLRNECIASLPAEVID